MNNTICKPSDKPQEYYYQSYGYEICSRCGKYIEGISIEVRPSFETSFRRNNLVYRYHGKCIETNQFILKLNYFRFYVLAILERLHYKMIFLEYFGLGYNQMKMKRKEKKLKSNSEQT